MLSKYYFVILCPRNHHDDKAELTNSSFAVFMVSCHAFNSDYNYVIINVLCYDKHLYMLYKDTNDNRIYVQVKN